LEQAEADVCRELLADLLRDHAALGATDKQKREYESMQSGTIQVLPPRGDNPRPNLLHVCFHVLFVVNMALVTIVRFGK